MSYILSQILKKKVPEWNEQIITENLFYSICSRAEVGFIESDDAKAQGEYIVHEGVPIIILSKRTKPQMRPWIMLHELGHHLLHYPTMHRFSKSIFSRIDRETNYFAAIGLMPTWLVKAKTPGEIAAEYGYPKEIIEIRREITVNFGI